MSAEVVPDIVIDCLVESPLWGNGDDWRSLAARAVRVAAEVAELDMPEDAELSLVLTDDAAIRILNRDHRGKDKPTNVLSFPGFGPDEDPVPLLGDIVIAHETVAREAAAEDKTMVDHFSHLIVHGILHLFGYDHETEVDAEIMEDEERRILASLGIADPYAESDVVA